MVAGLRGHQLERLECQQQARRMLYAPGGMIAQQLALNPTVLIVNDTAFAHGGILPTHGVPCAQRLCSTQASAFLILW